MKNLTLGGVDYRLDERLRAVHSKAPLEAAQAVVRDGGEFFSIVTDDEARSSSDTPYPVIDNAGQKGVLTGKVVVTLASEGDAATAAPAAENLGYARIGGRGRAMILEKQGADALSVVDDIERLTAIKGVEKATPQVVFLKAYR